MAEEQQSQSQIEYLPGDDFTNAYQKSATTNSKWTWMNLIKPEDLKKKLTEAEPNKNIEHTIGNVTLVFSKSPKKKDMFFVKTPEEAKQWSSKFPQRKAAIQYDYYQVQLLPFKEGNALLDSGEFFLIKDDVYQIIDKETGISEPRLFIGKRKERKRPE